MTQNSVNSYTTSRYLKFNLYDFTSVFGCNIERTYISGRLGKPSQGASLLFRRRFRFVFCIDTIFLFEHGYPVTTPKFTYMSTEIFAASKYHRKFSLVTGKMLKKSPTLVNTRIVVNTKESSQKAANFVIIPTGWVCLKVTDSSTNFKKRRKKWCSKKNLLANYLHGYDK